MKLTFRECITDDLETLRALSISTFTDAFGSVNTPDNLKAYLDQAFNRDKLLDELLNPLALFYFVYADGELSGYIKINEFGAQTDIHDPKSLEIERIYVKKEHQRLGLGTALIGKAIEHANARGNSYLWLGVWDKNEKAIRFYKKEGFYRIGAHPFYLGEDHQTDYILRKDLV
ncbi:MAG: GNAT family N-acetyltransferase [Christensenellales bacterium]